MTMGYEDMGEQLVEKVSTKTHIPVWGILFTLIILLGFAFSIFYCCCQRWWRKLRGKDGQKGVPAGKVDLRSVQLLGQTYKEKVSLSHYHNYFPDISTIK
jgi:synaptotagmin-1